MRTEKLRCPMETIAVRLLDYGLHIMRLRIIYRVFCAFYSRQFLHFSLVEWG